MHRFLFVLLLIATVSAGGSPRNRLHRQKQVRSYRESYQRSVKEVGTYRLPDDVIPTHYDIRLILSADLFVENNYFGVSTISTVVKNPTSSIQFHAKDLSIIAIVVTSGELALDITWTEIDPVTDIVTVLLKADLVKNQEYQLSIFFQGNLSLTALDGFYRSSYVQDGVVHYVGSTDSEPTSSRKIFPSFDEPEFKATFDFSFTVPKYLNVLFNTRIFEVEDVTENLKRISFETTPIMSTYLIAFIVSEYTCTEGEPVDGAPTQVCSTPETENLRGTAVEATPDILKVMQDYTKVSYAESHIGKLSQSSIPDYNAGAMENWGLVIYRETYLLWDEEESSNRYKQDVVTVVAHELSHQWFGDLVTLDWWGDIFLNEGFATYFEYHVPDEFHPDWELPKQFVVEQVQGALEGDAYDWSLPLSYYVESPDDISDRFDVISYDKGGTILRMVRYFVGLDNFKAALASYIAENKFSIGTPTSLWKSFDDYIEVVPGSQKLPASFSEIMENWTYKSGYPLLTVTSDGDDIVISQNQFLYYGTSDTKWYVPVTYSLSGESTSETATRAWLTPNEDLVLPQVLSDSDWVVLNNEQIGYYRVDYDDNLWQKISVALSKSDFGGIGTINRAQIVDDLFNFGYANTRNYTSILDFLSFLENETEYYPWYASFYGFSFLLSRAGDADLLASLQNLISKLMVRLYESVPFENEKPEDHIYTLTQALTLKWACSLNDENCIRNSIEKFADYRDNAIKPSRNLKYVIYCNALRHSDDASRDFDFLWSKYIETQIPTEQETILEALGCATDEDVLKEYLLKTISEDGSIRRQDVYTVYSSVYSGGTHGLNAAFDFVTTYYEQINAHFGSTGEVATLLYYVTNRFTTDEQLEKLRNFLEDTDVDTDLRVYAAEMYENAEENLEMTRTLDDDLKNYFTLRHRTE